jgi:hypothetical protein
MAARLASCDEAPRPGSPPGHEPLSVEPPLWVIMAATVMMMVGGVLYFTLIN